MADYIYLLEHRLSAAQRAAIILLRQLATDNGLTLFLVGGAVRDLTSGSPVRDLDFVVQGDASLLRPGLKLAGVEVVGEREPLQALYLRMPGGVRAELGSTLSASWPKPSLPIFQPSTLGEDLRRRDFTANAMALSLNEGSYGLLIDPLNGVADIENRQLRLVSNYGFIEEPIRMIRAARLMARLGWTLEEKTQTRYENGQQEGYINTLSDFERGYELEEIAHEEDPARVIKRLEAEGWMKLLAPYWTAAKINSSELEKLRELQVQLHTQGITTDGGTASFPLLTAKLSAKESATLKASFPRQGFVQEIEALDSESKEFAGHLLSKAANAPSAAWKLILSTKPETVLQTAFSSRSTAIQAKFKAFLTDWPQSRQKIPFAIMQEMRIVPEMDGYQDLVEQLFFELMDGRLGTTEEVRAFLEPYSPPAPPQPANLRRPRLAKKDVKPARSRGKKGKLDLEHAEDDPADNVEEDDDDPDLQAPAEEEDEQVLNLSSLDEDESGASEGEPDFEIEGDEESSSAALSPSVEGNREVDEDQNVVKREAPATGTTGHRADLGLTSAGFADSATKGIKRVQQTANRPAKAAESKNPATTTMAETTTKTKKASNAAAKQAIKNEASADSNRPSGADVVSVKKGRQKGI